MILLTGATGFLGNYVIKELVKKQSVCCLVRKASDVSSLGNTSIKLVYGDITDKESLDKISQKIDTIIHLAAVIQSGDSKLMHTANIEGTRNIIEFAIERKIKHFIFVSSYLADPKFKSEYGRTKLIAENIVKGSGLNYTIIRPTQIYGKGDKYNFTKLIQLIKTSPVIPMIGDGRYSLQPVYVKDLAMIIKQTVNKNFNKTYIAASDKSIEFNGLIDDIAGSLNLKRFKLHVPLFIILAALRLQKIFLGRQLIQPEQAKNMVHSNYIDTHALIQDFNISLREPKNIIETYK